MALLKSVARQYSAYLLVGITTVIVDTLATSLAFNFLAVSAFVASCIGFSAGFLLSFPINRGKVFHHDGDARFSLRLQVVLYSLLALFNLLFTSLLVHVLVHETPLPIEPTKLIVTAIMSVWNFIIFRQFIFAKEG